MVGLQVPLPLATGETTGGIVARLQEAAQRRRHRAPLAAGAERQPIPFDLRDDFGVAAQAARRLRADDGAGLELATA
ncbi:MAG TPA: hypothetical protein VH950_13365, partial [Gaiellaceae bacterium]